MGTRRGGGQKGGGAKRGGAAGHHSDVPSSKKPFSSFYFHLAGKLSCPNVQKQRIYLPPPHPNTYKALI